MCVKSGESVKVRHLVTLRSKPNLLLVSREELCSLGLTVLNSITVPFLFIFFLNLRQSTTQDRQRKKITKGRSCSTGFQDIFP